MDISLENEQLRLKLETILQEILDSEECYNVFSCVPDSIAQARVDEIYRFAKLFLGKNNKLYSLT